MFTLPDLPYAFDALEPHIDAQTMEIHHGKHHAAYIKNLNDLVTDKEEPDLVELLKTTDNPKIKNNGGGHYNHSLFWQVMAPGGSKLEGKLAAGIDSKFGSLDSFKEKFAAAAMGRFGSGWVWLVIRDKSLEIRDTANQDSPIMEGLVPILGLDVWEHAYYLKYQNRRADYIAAWWNVVNWSWVSKNFA